MTTEYAIQITLRDGRKILAGAGQPLDHPVNGLPLEMMRIHREAIRKSPFGYGDTSLYAGAQAIDLVRREVPDFEVDELYLSPMRCLEQFGHHNFQGDYGRWESKCSRCLYYEP